MARTVFICQVCGEGIYCNGNYTGCKCKHCGVEYEYNEGLRLILNDEDLEDILENHLPGEYDE
jgi:hypothetical protein